MITNPEIIKDAYRCNGVIKKYLVFECGIPILGYDEKNFYFANTEKLRECLKKMPVGVRLLSIFMGRR